MYKIISDSHYIPRWLKFILYLILTITCIYWLGLIIYKLLELLRKCINGITKEKGRWWFFLFCLLLIGVAICITLQYNPLIVFLDLVESWFEKAREFLVKLINGK